MFAIASPGTQPTGLSLQAAIVTPVSVNSVAAKSLSAPVAEHSSVSFSEQSSQGSSSGPSTAFLTQLISQNDVAQEDTDDTAPVSFADFSPAPHYNQLVRDSVVKYQPSDAGLPSSYTGIAPNEEAVNPSPPVQYDAYNVTQVRNQSNLATPTPQISTAG